MPERKPKDKASLEIFDIARKFKYETVWDRYELQEPHCGFGELGLCCKNCNLGPCRIDPFGEGPQYGACGADADIIAARNLTRHAAAGSACHSDHGREMARTLYLVGKGELKSYSIKAPEKLRQVAAEYGIKTEGMPDSDIAKELGHKMLEEFGQQEGDLRLLQRAPQRQKDIWKKLDILPQGIDRGIVEALSRTNMGVDNDYKNLIFGTMKAALADGWGGSMIATEVSDILFGAPKPIRSQVNLGVLKEDEVNIVVHGHVPLLSDIIAETAGDADMLELAEKQGA